MRPTWIRVERTESSTGGPPQRCEVRQSRDTPKGVPRLGGSWVHDWSNCWYLLIHGVFLMVLVSAWLFHVFFHVLFPWSLHGFPIVFFLFHVSSVFFSNMNYSSDYLPGWLVGWLGVTDLKHTVSWRWSSKRIQELTTHQLISRSETDWLHKVEISHDTNKQTNNTNKQTNKQVDSLGSDFACLCPKTIPAALQHICSAFFSDILCQQPASQDHHHLQAEDVKEVCCPSTFGFAASWNVLNDNCPQKKTMHIRGYSLSNNIHSSQRIHVWYIC